MLDILAAGTAASGPPAWATFLPIAGMIAIFWFLLIRPQMRQQKDHRARVAAVKKGDQVITAGGLVGKVVRIDDEYAEIEIAPGVKVRAVKATIGEIIAPGGKPAND
jgi:preprotein translocase subunit YajC